MAITYGRVLSRTRQHLDLEVLCLDGVSRLTCIASWGELTSTLENISSLIFLPLLRGEHHGNCSWWDQVQLDGSSDCLEAIGKIDICLPAKVIWWRRWQPLQFHRWGLLSLLAFIVVMLSGAEDRLNPYVFPLPIMIIQGVRLALVPPCIWAPCTWIWRVRLKISPEQWVDTMPLHMQTPLPTSIPLGEVLHHPHEVCLEFSTLVT